jgi:hypothetical protein
MQNPSFSHRRVPAHLENDFNPPSPAPPVPHVESGASHGKNVAQGEHEQKDKAKEMGTAGRDRQKHQRHHRVRTCWYCPSSSLCHSVPQSHEEPQEAPFSKFGWFPLIFTTSVTDSSQLLQPCHVLWLLFQGSHHNPTAAYLPTTKASLFILLYHKIIQLFFRKFYLYSRVCHCWQFMKQSEKREISNYLQALVTTWEGILPRFWVLF